MSDAVKMDEQDLAVSGEVSTGPNPDYREPDGWRGIEIVATPGTEFGIMTEAGEFISIVTRREGEDWPHNHVPTHGINIIAPGHMAYVVRDDRPRSLIRADVMRLLVTELEAAFKNYLRTSTTPTMSPYIRENGRHGGSPWSELSDAINAVIAPALAAVPAAKEEEK